jgi:hypothetical protein
MKIKYTDETIDAELIRDFLPQPEELEFNENSVTITIALSDSKTLTRKFVMDHVIQLLLVKLPEGLYLATSDNVQA